MKNINNNIHNDYFDFYSSKEIGTNLEQNVKKLGISTYMYNCKKFRIYEKKKEKNNSTINEAKNRQKQLKKYLCNNNKKEVLGHLNKGKNNIKEMNTTDILSNNGIKNIKVNKIKIEDIYKEKINNSYTKRDFYNKPLEVNKSFNFYKNQNKFQNNNDLLNFLNDNKKNQRKSNLISVRSFNKNKDFINDQLLTSEYNLMNTLNKDISNYSFYQSNNLNNNINYYKRTNSISNLYSYNNLTTPGKNKNTSNTSKLLVGFKNIKTFYAHLEILISLYLKRNFKDFIEKMKEHNSNKISNKYIYENINHKNRPIINVNNAHCSLYCSININPNTNSPEYNHNKLFKTVFNTNNTPMTKINEIEKENIKLLDKKMFNKINKNKLLFLSNESDINFNKSKKYLKEINKSVYFPKNKISKFNNNNNLVNEVKGKVGEAEEKREIFNYLNDIKNNNNHDIKKSSPIKEMNINLKKINVCKINDLNKIYSNHKLYNNSSNNIKYSEINNIMNINNNSNNVMHSKINSNIIQINKKDNNGSNDKEKNKLKKISSAKNCIYTKPKDKNKAIIKEIKIQSTQLTPYKDEIKNTINNKNKKFRKENISPINNSFLNLNSDKINNNLSNSQEKSIIKKIYIIRDSKNKSKTKENLNENKKDNIVKNNIDKKYKSNFLANKKDKKEKGFTQKEMLIKLIKTSDKRLFINIKYIILNNIFMTTKKEYDLLYLKIENKISLAIINNKLVLSEGQKDYDKFEISNIFSFDNDKKENNNLFKLIKKIKDVIVNNIRKRFLYNYKKYKLLRKIILNNNKKLINIFFRKLKNKKDIKKIKDEKNNCVIYHKINYNDDFNLIKRMKSPNNIKQNINNINYKAKPYNLTSQNSIQLNKNIKKKNKRRELSSNIIFNNTLKYINKEINIFVHENNKITDK